MSEIAEKTIQFTPIAGRRVAYYNLHINSPAMNRALFPLRVGDCLHSTK